MQISEAAGGVPAPGTEPCRFPKLEECAHFHYERVQLPKVVIQLQTNIDQSLHSQHNNDDDDTEWYMVQVTSGDQCWLVQRNFENFKMLDAQLHQCIYDRKIFQLNDLSSQSELDEDIEMILQMYLERFSQIVDNSVNCGPVLNWLQMDNKGHRLLVPSEESRSINTPAVAAAYSVRRYVSQARDELNLEVGDMISVIDMASPGESMWWRGKRGFQVGFFPQHCVHIIGDKVPRNMPLPPPVVGSLALTPIKPVLRKHGKLITFFRSFILNRPSRRRLKQSGILKERVFGCDLGEHLLNSDHDIPMVLKCCAEFIETHGIVDGIYRLSGVTSNIQKLRNAFDEDRIPNLYTEDILQDIHSVASLLKMYFRELPNPLCTYQLYQSFVNAVQGCCGSTTRNSESDHDRLLKMREAVQKLPPPHYRTLEYLMKHLAKVAKHGPSTGMTTRNVAIVWAPNLLRCAELEVGGVAALQGVGVQAVVTEFLICYAHLIFCDHLPNLDLPILITNNDNNLLSSPKKCRPKSLAILSTSTTLSSSTPVQQTPTTKLITLEEARNKQILLSITNNSTNNKNNNDESNNYIEVGGGPKNLPKKYHTVIELPAGGAARKRTHTTATIPTKRSPLGWRSLFTTKSSRNNSQNNLIVGAGASGAVNSVGGNGALMMTSTMMPTVNTPLKSRKASSASTPGCGINISGVYNDINNSKSLVMDVTTSECDLTDLMKRKLRTVKSAESLTTTIRSNDGHSESMNLMTDDDVLGPLLLCTNNNNNNNKSSSSSGGPGHNRSVSHDSYFDVTTTTTNTESMQNLLLSSHNRSDDDDNIDGSLLDLSEIQLNFELEESEMRIFSEDESLMSSPRLHYSTVGSTGAGVTSGAITSSGINAGGSQRRILTRARPEEFSSQTNSGNPSPKKQARVAATTAIVEQQLPPNSPDLTNSRCSTKRTRLEDQLSDIQYIDCNTPDNVVSTMAIVHDVPAFNSDHQPSPPTRRNKSSPRSTNYTRSNFAKQNRQSLNLHHQIDATNNSVGDGDYVGKLLPKSNTEMNFGRNNIGIGDGEKRFSIQTPTSPIKSPSYRQFGGDGDGGSATTATTPADDNDDDFSSGDGGSPTTNNNDMITYQNLVMDDDDDKIKQNDDDVMMMIPNYENILTTISITYKSPPPSRTTPDSSSSPSPMKMMLYENVDLNPDKAIVPSTTSVASLPAQQASQPDLLIFTNNKDDDGLVKNTSQQSSSLVVADDNSSVMLIEFSPTTTETVTVTNNEKRKSSETNVCFDDDHHHHHNDDNDDDNSIYQQVKFFRRSIHEVNSMLISTTVDNNNDDDDKIISSNYEDIMIENNHHYDSLEQQQQEQSLDVDDDVSKLLIYENVDYDVDSLKKNKQENTTNNVDNEEKEKLSVKDLTTKFEVKNPEIVDPTSDVIVTNNNQVKKFYEKDSLPPCLRARNLKYQLVKTRSLDEDQFQKEFESLCVHRHHHHHHSGSSSVGVGGCYKTNSLPKSLNLPKLVPGTAAAVTADAGDNNRIDSLLHLSHLHHNDHSNSRSSENLHYNNQEGSSEEDQKKKRERIEKYKEERRKYLHDKYRTESFKEDKDVLLAKMKLFHKYNNDEMMMIMQDDADKLIKLEEKLSNDPTSDVVVTTNPSGSGSLKSRAAIFEQQPQLTNNTNNVVVVAPVNSTLGINQRFDLNHRSNLLQRNLMLKQQQQHQQHIKKQSPKIKNHLKIIDKVEFPLVEVGVEIRGSKNVGGDVSSDGCRRHTFETTIRGDGDDEQRNTGVAGDLMELDRLRRVSLDSPSSVKRKEKSSPSYCIKDMKAIFEPKSKQ